MITTYNTSCLSCAPKQIISLTVAINDISKIAIYNQKGEIYCDCDMQYSYSLDGACWSCFSCKDDMINITSGLNSDFYIRVKMSGAVGNVQYECQDVEWSAALDLGFNLQYDCSTQQLTYSPYTNMDSAIALNQYLSNVVNCIVGIPIYYFKVQGTEGTKDITFKEYALTNIVAVKQIKLIVLDGVFPSSKPEFNDFGIDFSTDWETDINKAAFATAFGDTAQPQQGDLIYIPMMKRMWMVNGAYEEKRDGFMWQTTTFKVLLVKYQEKESLDLGNQEEFISTLVASNYEELFGTEENIDSSEEHLEAPVYAATRLYNVFESDAIRKQASVESITFNKEKIYQKATKLSDNLYSFLTSGATITYQQKYCGNEGTISFIFRTNFIGNLSQTMLQIAGIKLLCNINDDNSVTLQLFNNKKSTLTLKNNVLYFVYLKWSRKLNIIEFTACELKYPTNMPKYKLQHFHYYFDLDNPADTKVSKYDIEMTLDAKGEVVYNSIPGIFTNFKLFDVYINDISEILLQLPNNLHLLINDVAREFLDLNGVKL